MNLGHVQELRALRVRSLLLGLVKLGSSSNPVSYTHLRAHETLRYLVCRLLLAYTTAYFLLKGEDEVDDGLSDFSPGQNIKDTPALITLSLVALMGGYYCFRALLSPGAVSELVEPGALEHGLGSPSNVTVAVGGSLFLVYFLWTVLTLSLIHI